MRARSGRSPSGHFQDRRTSRTAGFFAATVIAVGAPLCVSLSAQNASSDPVSIDAGRYQQHIDYLASDELQGRGTGSPELETAARYIADEFAAAGVAPAPGTDDYLQWYEAQIGAHLDKDNRLVSTLNGKPTSLTVRNGFIPFSFSSSGEADNVPVVFAGYGITAADLGYDDYAGIDVKDKFVLLLRHEPQENDANSVFGGLETTSHSTFANKAVNAKLHGAKGVILINDTYHHPRSDDELVDFGRADGPSDAGILFVQVTADTAEPWLKSTGRDLETIMDDINETLKPESFTIPNLTVSMNVDIVRERKRVPNVAAYIPGETDEYVVIGAHFDHLGLGDEHSLAPKQIGQVHHGADDNASGTAGVVELARWFAQHPPKRRGVLFLAFSGEELGLLGSSHFVEDPLLPLKNAVAMLNMDMIGRVPEVGPNAGRIYVNGTGTGSNLDELVASARKPADLNVDLSESTGYGGSDHISFSSKQIPVIFFFSGLHGDYHKPSDTADKINHDHAARVVEYVGEIATAIANAPERPEFQRLESSNPHGGGDAGGPVSSGSGSGYGPSFGSVPDFNEPETGVRFADIRPGTPADKAGLLAGDILVEFGGQKIENLYDFTYALQAHQPGDEVLVKVLRGTEAIEAKVLLTERE